MSAPWGEPPNEIEVTLASFALDGHPDDVRTMIGLMMVLAGFVDVLREFVGEPDNLSNPETLVAIARSWDGFDGEEDVDKVREAVAVLAGRVQVLRS